MNDLNLAEFSIFYKRLMIVENCLKQLIINKYTLYYGENAYNILYRYMKILDSKRPAGQIFEKIHGQTKSNYEKLQLSINKMYLSEILNLFSNHVFLKNKKVKNNLFSEKIETNSSDFQQKQKVLKEFRNCIAHCDIKKYSIERKKFIKCLIYFEKILNCNVLITYSMIEEVSTSLKLSVWEILAYIYHMDKTYFDDDKYLILLFDDIALINGYTFESLPQRWSIIRQKFNIQRLAKEGKAIESKLINRRSQLRLPLV